MKHASVVRDLGEGEEEEAHVHALHNRAEAGHSRADAHPLRENEKQWASGMRSADCCVVDVLRRQMSSKCLTMKLYSQIGVSRRRNSPYFLYRSYVTCAAQGTVSMVRLPAPF